MRALDLLFAASPHDGLTATHANRSSVLDAPGLTLEANGSDAVLTAPASPAWQSGSLGILTGGGKTAFVQATKIADSTHIRLRPIQSVADSPGVIGHVFPAGSTLVSDSNFRRTFCTLTADLSDAPLEAFDYLLLGCGSFSHDSLGNIRMSIRSECLWDDPMSGAQVCTSRFTRVGSAGDPINYFGSRRVSLTPGQRYEFHLRAGTAAAGGVVTGKYAHLLALRYTSIYKDASHNGDSAPETNATGDFVAAASLGNNGLPPGLYLVSASWAAGCSDPNQNLDVELNDVAGSLGVIAWETIRVANSADRPPAGFLGILNVGAVNHIQVRHKAASGATSTIESVQLSAIPLSAIPALAGHHVSGTLPNLASITDQAAFATVTQSDQVALESGMHLEIIAAGIAGSDEYVARPHFDAATDGNTGPGEHGAPFDFNTFRPLPTVWFNRRERQAGNTRNRIEAKVDDGTGTVAVHNALFSWIREHPPLVPVNDTKVTLVAELENGGMCLRKWGTQDGHFKHDMASDVERISRVLVNGVPYTQVASYASLADNTWWWDEWNQRLWIHMPSGDSPADPDQVVIVVPLMRVGREHEDLLDDSGKWRPYSSRVNRVPSISENLQDDDARTGSTTALGELRLAAGDRFWDDIIGQRPFPGYRCRVYRGYKTLSSKLRDFEIIADAVLDEPALKLAGGPSYFDLKLYDRGLNLSKPVLSTLITTWSGSTADSPSTETSRDNQAVPDVWGPFRKLAAFRVTHTYGSSNWNEYQLVGHALSTVTAAYVDASRNDPISAGNRDFGATYIDAGRVRIKNAAFADPDRPPDAVFVDGTGYPYATPGTIARHLLTAKGGQAATDLVEATYLFIDRKWRRQLKDGVGRIPLPVSVSFIVDDPEETIGDALTRHLNDCGAAYWRLNHAGRVALAVRDFDAGNLTENGGAEDAANGTFPYSAIGGGSIAGAVTTQAYYGQRCFEVSNGGSAEARFVGVVNLPHGDATYALTLQAALKTGVGTAFRLAIVAPDGERRLGPTETIVASAWRRKAIFFDVPQGCAGTAWIYVYPAFGLTDATVVYLDEIKLYEGIVAKRAGSLPLDSYFRSQHFYECDTRYDVNLQDPDHAPIARRNDREAEGLALGTPSEGKFAVPSSKRVRITGLANGLASAAGISASVVSIYSKARLVMPIDVDVYRRLPSVGDYVFHDLNPRVPTLSNRELVHQIELVSHESDDAKVVSLEAARPLDPVADRATIIP